MAALIRSETNVNPIIARLLSLIAVLFLAACASTPPMPQVVPGYEEVQDGDILIKAVPSKYLGGSVPRTEVDYAGPDKPGSIVIDTFARRLYYVLEGGRAIRYTIAVGREGLAFRGSGYIGRKEHWPSWTPTANMLRTQGDMYRDFAGGLPGGLDNPLGARAMYLYRGGRDSYFRIHGTIDNSSIGRATSAGCIRLFNQDAMDLFERVKIGARVKVRSEAESIELEGQMMDDINGHPIPYDAVLAEKIAIQKAKAEAAAAVAAAAEAAAVAEAEAAAVVAAEAAKDAAQG